MVSVIPSGYLKPAYPRQVDERLSTTHKADLRALDVIPAHRDLRDSESQPPGHKQRLDIEAEAVDLLPREDRTRGIAAEEFKSALSISNLQPDGELHDPVKQLAGGFAKTRLVDPDQRTIERARADSNLRAPASFTAFHSFSNSAMGAERSASVRSRQSIVEASIPSRTAWPLPRLPGLRRTRTQG